MDLADQSSAIQGILQIHNYYCLLQMKQFIQKKKKKKLMPKIFPTGKKTDRVVKAL